MWFIQRDLSTAKKIIIAACFAVLLAAVGCTIFLTKDYYSKTIKVVTSEGDVTFATADGVVKKCDSNGRINTGDCILTGEDGIASVALDNSKTITIENNSLVFFTKNGNSASADISNGGLFFENSSSLSVSESFVITCEMLELSAGAGSGYIHANDDGTVTLILTSGYARVYGTDPATGTVKELSVIPGQKITVSPANGIEYTAESISEYDLDPFLLNCLLDRWELRDAVCTATGWNNETLTGLADGSIYIRDEEEPDETEETEEADTTPAPSPTPRPTATPTPVPEVIPGEEPVIIPEQPVEPVQPAEPTPVPETESTEATEPAPTEATEAPAEQPQEQPQEQPVEQPAEQPAE